MNRVPTVLLNRDTVIYFIVRETIEAPIGIYKNFAASHHIFVNAPSLKLISDAGLLIIHERGETLKREGESFAGIKFSSILFVTRTPQRFVGVFVGDFDTVYE